MRVTMIPMRLLMMAHDSTLKIMNGVTAMEMWKTVSVSVAEMP